LSVASPFSMACCFPFKNVTTSLALFVAFGISPSITVLTTFAGFVGLIKALIAVSKIPILRKSSFEIFTLSSFWKY
jgi:hypothetical protein